MKSKAAGKCPVIPYEEFIALPPDELNSYLRREFQVGLYAFAAMLFEVIREPIKKRRVKIQAHDGWIFWGWHPTENRPMNDAELRNKHHFFAVEMKSLAALHQAGRDHRGHGVHRQDRQLRRRVRDGAGDDRRREVLGQRQARPCQQVPRQGERRR